MKFEPSKKKKKKMTTKTKFYQRIQWNYSHTDTTHYKTTITNKPHIS